MIELKNAFLKVYFGVISKCLKTFTTHEIYPGNDVSALSKLQSGRR